MDKNTKIALGLGAAILFCLCSVGVAFLAFRTVFEKAKDAIITEPGQISSVADKIATYEIPQGYSEQMAMDFGIYRIVMIAPADTTDKPMIMLMSYNSTGVSPEQMQQEMQRSLEQQSGQPGVTWTTVDERTMSIRGQEVLVTEREGRSNNGFALRQMVTAFEGESGTVLIMIQGNAASWDEKLVNEFLTSIQ